MAFFIAVLLILLSLAAATYFVGSFFMSIAIIRKEKPSDAFVPEEEKAKRNEKKESIRGNRELLERRAKELLRICTEESLSADTPDGLRLSASFFPVKGSHRYAILVHGYTGSRKEMISKAYIFHTWGYSVLTPDNRAHGESEGRYIGMGWLDKDDLKLWIDWIRRQDREARIVLLGVSMGGAAVMMAAGDMNPGVEAVIDDCGYTSVWDIFKDELRSLYHLPSFPILNMCSIMIKLKAGYDIKKASSLKQLEKAMIPILFIHGSDDMFVKTYMVYKNYDAKTHGDKDLLIIDGAGHAEAEATDPDLYFKTIRNFLNKHNL